jgi:hypothetical protein
MKALHLGNTGEDVRALQLACNARAKTRDIPQIYVDGELGPLTRTAARQVGRALGVLDATLAQDDISVGLQRIIRYPRLRSPAQLVRARKRKRAGGSLRERAWRQMQKLIEAHVSEQGGNNRGAEVEAIIRANGGTPGEPWCGDTVAYCYLKAGAKSVVRSWAAVRLIEKLLTRVRSPRRGHVVTYKFDHTGLFKEWAPEHGGGFFYAGEGNTGDAGAVSDSRTGRDGVKLKLRHVDQVAGFWRVLR